MESHVVQQFAGVARSTCKRSAPSRGFMLHLRKAAGRRISLVRFACGLHVGPSLPEVLFPTESHRRFNPVQLECALRVASVTVTMIYLETVVAGSRRSRVGLGHTVRLLLRLRKKHHVRFVLLTHTGESASFDHLRASLGSTAKSLAGRNGKVRLA